MKTGINIFFGEKDLRGLLYTLHLRNSSIDERKNLSAKIFKYGGVFILLKL